MASCRSQEDFLLEEDEKIVLSPEIIAKLEGGEIIMRKGRGYLSNVIVKLMGENLNYSHAGIVIKTDSIPYIIHSLSDEVSSIDGVQKATIPFFVADIADSALCIVRPKCSKKELQLIQQTALHYLKQKIPFDHGFNNQTKDELHCMELVHDVLEKSLKKDLILTSSKKEVLFYPFSSFFNPKNFELVFELKPYSKSLNLN